MQKRCDRKNRNHFYFEGTVPDIPEVGDFYDECEPGIAIVVRIPDSYDSWDKLEPGFNLFWFYV